MSSCFVKFVTNLDTNGHQLVTNFYLKLSKQPFSSDKKYNKDYIYLLCGTLGTLIYYPYSLKGLLGSTLNKNNGTNSGTINKKWDFATFKSLGGFKMNNQKIIDLANFFLFDTMQLIETVVNEEEPEKSAVTAKKRLKLYIDVMKDVDLNFTTDDIKDLILSEGYDESFFEEFENKRQAELKYYVGDID